MSWAWDEKIHHSRSWTGRAPHQGTPIDLLRRWIHSKLYPSFECQQCVGQDEWQGCYCAYYGGSPCGGPETWRVHLRNLFNMQPPCEQRHKDVDL